MNKILVISKAASDLSELILKHCPGSALVTPDLAVSVMDNYDAICILAGNEEGENAYILSAPLHCKLDEVRAWGKPVFTEFVCTVGAHIPDGISAMRQDRMVYLDNGQKGAVSIQGLKKGDILDGHENDCIKYIYIPEDADVLLVYHPYLCAHDHVEKSDEELRKGIKALFLPDKNTLISGMRFCNFRRARLAPQKSWEAVITGVVSFLAGEQVELTFPEPVCTFKKGCKVTCASDTDEAVDRALAWFRNADMIINNGKNGIKEGLSHRIYAKNGVQRRGDGIRNDCTCESGGAFGMDAFIRGNEASREIYENAKDFCFTYFQVKNGPNKGMMRWSQVGWEACYQDDVCRAILPSLLEANYAGNTRYFAEIQEALDYLVKTTGKNGLRRARTDMCYMNEEMMAKLREEECNMTSAHHNGYYFAALLLAYRAGGSARYLEVAEKGISSIMACYPDNLREHSETQENCRLILPLAVLYQVTGKEEHKQWLYRVTEALMKVRHECGAYMEWDTGYKAHRARVEKGECSLLADNGDPVADMLYSVNWLPLGFAYAYLVTKDEMFYQLWCDLASFFLSSQIYSEDKTLDGAWTRAFDLKRWEVYGVPHDLGWAPCCVETGWTVGEILMGFQFMHLVEKLVK